MTTNDDIVMVTKYRLAQADTLNAQVKEAEIWATMTQAQRRLVISGTATRLPQ